MASQPHDLYELLGVARNATQEEIRRAYRRLARELHPDVSADPATEERFKQMTAAYEILSDPEKRQRYDTFGTTAGPAGTSPFMDISDIFEMFFGAPMGRRQGTRASRTRPGEALAVALDLTFQEAAFGVTRELQVEVLEACEICQGNGCEPGTSPVRCGNCGGTGQVQDMSRSIFGTVMTSRTCTTCQGTGEQITSRCDDCLGEGRVRRSRTVEVDVPQGVSDGLELRVTGAGNAGRAGGTPGDLYVALRVEPHPVFERRGQDLFAVLEVPMTQAALGAQLEVETLDRSEVVKIDAGTASGSVVRVRNGGVPNLGRRGRGDLFLTVKVVTPEPTSREEKKLLEQLAEIRGEKARKGPTPAGLRKPRRSDG